MDIECTTLVLLIWFYTLYRGGLLDPYVNAVATTQAVSFSYYRVYIKLCMYVSLGAFMTGNSCKVILSRELGRSDRCLATNLAMLFSRRSPCFSVLSNSPTLLG